MVRGRRGGSGTGRLGRLHLLGGRELRAVGVALVRGEVGEAAGAVDVRLRDRRGRHGGERSERPHGDGGGEVDEQALEGGDLGGLGTALPQLDVLELAVQTAEEADARVQRARTKDGAKGDDAEKGRVGGGAAEDGHDGVGVGVAGRGDVLVEGARGNLQLVTKTQR